jgi:hypothetical protein
MKTTTIKVMEELISLALRIAKDQHIMYHKRKKTNARFKHPLMNPISFDQRDDEQFTPRIS